MNDFEVVLIHAPARSANTEPSDAAGLPRQEKKEHIMRVVCRYCGWEYEVDSPVQYADEELYQQLAVIGSYRLYTEEYYCERCRVMIAERAAEITAYKARVAAHVARARELGVESETPDERIVWRLSSVLTAEAIEVLETVSTVEASIGGSRQRDNGWAGANMRGYYAVSLVDINAPGIRYIGEAYGLDLTQLSPWEIDEEDADDDTDEESAPHRGYYALPIDTREALGV